MWIRAAKGAQASFLRALEQRDGMAAALDAACSLYDFAETSPADARLLASMRREDLIAVPLTPELTREFGQSTARQS